MQVWWRRWCRCRPASAPCGWSWRRPAPCRPSGPDSPPSPPPPPRPTAPCRAAGRSTWSPPSAACRRRERASSQAWRTIRSIPARVKTATSMPTSRPGWPRWARPPTPAYSPSEFSRTITQSIARPSSGRSGPVTPGSRREGRTLAYWSKALADRQAQAPQADMVGHPRVAGGAEEDRVHPGDRVEPVGRHHGTGLEGSAPSPSRNPRTPRRTRRPRRPRPRPPPCRRRSLPGRFPSPGIGRNSVPGHHRPLSSMSPQAAVSAVRRAVQAPRRGLRRWTGRVRRRQHARRPGGEGRHARCVAGEVRNRHPPSARPWLSASAAMLPNVVICRHSGR